MTKPEIDPHTGRLTTGHEWNGIKELSTPIPKIVWAFYISTTIVAILLWILYPAWPTGKSFTPGILGSDQTISLEQSLDRAQSIRAESDAKILERGFEEIRSDPELAHFVATNGSRLFSDNCAACHGPGGSGGNGYPDLTDQAWLWGGSPDQILETLAVGVNTTHPDTRISQMLAFGESGILNSDERDDVATFVLSLSNEHIAGEEDNQAAVARGAGIFELQCSSCHGPDGTGIAFLGAPDLTDDFWLYGGSEKEIKDTINHGRQGVMPYWSERISEVDRKILTAYILSLGEEAE